MVARSDAVPGGKRGAAAAMDAALAMTTPQSSTQRRGDFCEAAKGQGRGAKCRTGNGDDDGDGEMELSSEPNERVIPTTPTEPITFGWDE